MVAPDHAVPGVRGRRSASGVRAGRPGCVRTRRAWGRRRTCECRGSGWCGGLLSLQSHSQVGVRRAGTSAPGGGPSKSAAASPRVWSTAGVVGHANVTGGKGSHSFGPTRDIRMSGRDSGLDPRPRPGLRPSRRQADPGTPTAQLRTGTAARWSAGRCRSRCCRRSTRPSRAPRPRRAADIAKAPSASGVSGLSPALDRPVEVADLLGVRHVADVEDPQAGEDHRAGDQVRVGAGRQRAVVGGVPLHRVLGTRVVLLVALPGLGLVHGQPDVGDHIGWRGSSTSMIRAAPTGRSPGDAAVGGVVGELVELEQVLVAVAGERLGRLRDRALGPVSDESTGTSGSASRSWIWLTSRIRRPPLAKLPVAELPMLAT